jgi:CrcB protein
MAIKHVAQYPRSFLSWEKLAANLIGGYLVGCCVAFFQTQPNLDPAWRLFLITGFLDALTTFSSFSAEMVAMLSRGRMGVTMVSIGLHLIGSLLMTLAGLKTVALLLK